MRGDFTLSYHYFRQQDSRNHLELFLDVDGKSDLETWRHFPSIRRERLLGTGRDFSRSARFVAAPSHRRIYLDFSGPVSGDRGKLRVLRRGKFIDRRTGSGDAIRVTL